MQPYSRLADAVAREEKTLERLFRMQPATAWQGKAASAAARDKRRKANKDFWQYDNHYFPPEVYKQGYAAPCHFHRSVVNYTYIPGIHTVLGPRKHGKTVTALKRFAHALVTGEWSYIVTWGSTLKKAKRLMRSIALLITRNPRITHDYDIEIITNSSEEFRAIIDGREVLIEPASPGRSLRGALDLFDRPQAILSDDRQTVMSTRNPDANRTSNLKLREAYKSCASGAVVLDLANNFAEDCVYNELKKQFEEGTLDPGWRVYIYAAWSDDTGPLWAAMYQANDEDELRLLLECSEEEWSGEMQQNPQAAGGYIFPDEYWQEYDEVPPDAVGAGYNDPNLAIKLDKSDTTAMGALLYSPSLDHFFVYRPRCKPYDDADELLTDYHDVSDFIRVLLLGFDGNVNQEAVWTNFVLNWCIRHKRPFPRIVYCRYDVDLHIKSVQIAYREKRISFPRVWHDEQEKQRARKQLTKFKGKKKKGKAKVDFPDWLICVFQLLHDPEVRLGEGYSREIKVTTYEEPFEY